MLDDIVLSELTFKRIARLATDHLGIMVEVSKKEMIRNKLLKYLQEKNYTSFEQYINSVEQDEKEKLRFFNALTVNETSFFREPKHFDLLKQVVLPGIEGEINCWSAAGSSGAEAYSMAMVIDHTCRFEQKKWKIMVSDINTEMIAEARRGIYPMSAMQKIPKEYVRKYCLKGVGEYNGMFAIDDELKQHMRFKQINLIHPPNFHEKFDVIFLRNVLIYFSEVRRRGILKNVLGHLKEGGYIFVGHSERLSSLAIEVKQVIPTVYQKVKD